MHLLVDWTIYMIDPSTLLSEHPCTAYIGCITCFKSLSCIFQRGRPLCSSNHYDLLPLMLIDQHRVLIQFHLGQLVLSLRLWLGSFIVHVVGIKHSSGHLFHHIRDHSCVQTSEWCPICFVIQGRSKFLI